MQTHTQCFKSIPCNNDYEPHLHTLIVHTSKVEFAKEIAFKASLAGFRSQVALRECYFDFEVRFLSAAITKRGWF